MTDADDLWTATKAAYDADGLISLTNIRAREATAIDDAVGVQAAQSAIDLWPLYAQVAYDGANGAHVEVGRQAVIAILYNRGGTSEAIEKVRWDAVFGDGGLMERLKRTSSRGRPGPASNSGTITSQETGTQYGWSDRASLPPGYAPSRRGASDD